MENDISLRIDDIRTLWLTEISRRTFEEQDLFELHSDGGLFVVLEDLAAGTFNVLAKVASHEAGSALIQMLTRSFGPTPVVV